METVQQLDDAEHHKRHNQEAEHGVEKAAQHEVAAAGQGDRQASQGLIVPGEDAEHRVEDVVYQGVGDSLERAADDDADGQIHHVAPGNEFAEFGQKAGGLFFCRHRISLNFPNYGST